MNRDQLLPCPYEGQWAVDGRVYCYFHAKVAASLLEASWRRPREATSPAERSPDEILTALIREWEGGPDVVDRDAVRGIR